MKFSPGYSSPPAACSDRAHATLLLAAFATGYWLVVLFLDRGATPGQQLVLGATTWAFLIVALRLSPPAERTQVLSMIFVASCCEVIGSLIWGAYQYRLENIPLYVPPGHGLFFLMAIRISELPLIERRGQLLRGMVLLGSLVLLVRGMVLLPSRDMLGLATWLVLLIFLCAGRRPTFYAVSYTLTMALEFYGTSQGNWAWAPILPYVGIGVANPPFGIGGAYCTMDAVARRLAPRAERALHAFQQEMKAMRPQPSSRPDNSERPTLRTRHLEGRRLR